MVPFDKNLTDYSREYFSRCSIHGFQYFSERNRTLFERIWWVFIFAVSITTCFYIVYGSYQQWSKNSVVITISNKPTPIYDIEFPAVTICPTPKIPHLGRIINDPIRCRGFFYAVYLCQKTNIRLGWGNCSFGYSDPSPFDVQGKELVYVMDKVKPKVYYPSCRFFNEQLEFVRTLTAEGICYSVNMMDSRQIFKNVPSYMHLNENTTVSSMGKIHVQYHPGIKKGLEIVLYNADDEKDNCISKEEFGYKVFLHSPRSYPGFINTFFLALNENKKVKLKPKVVQASETIRKYDVKKRKCYFEGEKKLKYFQNYTKMNCELECWANYTLDICGCAHFSMPKDEKTLICVDGFHHRCATILAKEMVTNDNMVSQNDDSYPLGKLYPYFNNLARSLSPNKPMNFTMNILHCNCLPTCSEIDYEADISEKPIDFVAWMRAANFMFPDPGVKYKSTVEVFFDQSEFVTYERKELYGPLEFLANFGGLLGLFCGFSVLSLVEILYFLSIRIICNKRLYGRWMGEKD